MSVRPLFTLSLSLCLLACGARPNERDDGGKTLGIDCAAMEVDTADILLAEGDSEVRSVTFARETSRYELETTGPVTAQFGNGQASMDPPGSNHQTTLTVTCTGEGQGSVSVSELSSGSLQCSEAISVVCTPKTASTCDIPMMICSDALGDCGQGSRSAAGTCDGHGFADIATSQITDTAGGLTVVTAMAEPIPVLDGTSYEGRYQVTLYVNGPSGGVQLGATADDGEDFSTFTSGCAADAENAVWRDVDGQLNQFISQACLDDSGLQLDEVYVDTYLALDALDPEYRYDDGPVLPLP